MHKIANCKTANCELVVDSASIIEKLLTRLILPIIYEDLISSTTLVIDGSAVDCSFISNGGIQTNESKSPSAAHAASTPI